MIDIKSSNGLINGIIRYFIVTGREESIKVDGLSLDYVVYPVKNLIDSDPTTQWRSPDSSSFGQAFYLSIKHTTLLLNSYALHSQTGSNCYPKTWDVYASNDNSTWTLIANESQTTALSPNEHVKFDVNVKQMPAKYYKWVNRGKNNCGTSHFYLGTIELFGKILSERFFSCKVMRSSTCGNIFSSFII